MLYIFSVVMVSGLWAQDQFKGLIQPRVSIGTELSKRLVVKFSLAHRAYIYQPEEFAVVAKQIDLGHRTEINIMERQKLILGAMYRFQNIFEDGKYNEIRFLQYYNFESTIGGLSQNIRTGLEERLRLDGNVFRLRCKWSLKIPFGSTLNQNDRAYFFITKLESLFSIGEAMSPQLDQRISLGIEKNITSRLTYGLTLQHRFMDYLETPHNRLLILFQLSIEV